MQRRRSACPAAALLRGSQLQLLLRSAAEQGLHPPPPQDSHTRNRRLSREQLHWFTAVPMGEKLGRHLLSKCR